MQTPDPPALTEVRTYFRMFDREACSMNSSESLLKIALDGLRSPKRESAERR